MRYLPLVKYLAVIDRHRVYRYWPFHFAALVDTLLLLEPFLCFEEINLSAIHGIDTSEVCVRRITGAAVPVSGDL